MAANPRVNIDTLFASLSEQNLESQARIVQCDRDLERLHAQLKEKDEALKAVGTKRARALIVFMKQHTEEQERTSELHRTRQRIESTWDEIAGLQAQQRDVQSRLADLEAAGRRVEAERSALSKSGAVVDARLACPGLSLHREVDTLVIGLRECDARVAEEEAAARAEAAEREDAARAAASEARKAARAAAAARLESEPGLLQATVLQVVGATGRAGADAAAVGRGVRDALQLDPDDLEDTQVSRALQELVESWQAYENPPGTFCAM